MISGGIIMWSGAVVDIPAGYVLCDGNNDTPDLRNRFLVGAGDSYAVGANGGAVNHNHTFEGNGHYHNLLVGTDVAAGTDYAVTNDTEWVAGTTDNGDGRPPYYSLAYIMKT